MATISLEQIKVAFSVAADVYARQIGPIAAAKQLESKAKLNINSAKDFIDQYRCMVEGTVFKRSLSAAALAYVLPEIERTRGERTADNAVAATWLHVAYYEGFARSRLGKLRATIDQFQAARGQHSSAMIEECRFMADVAQSVRDGTAARRMRLKTANPIPDQVEVKTKVYVRNTDVVAEVLDRASGYCEGCLSAAPFNRKSDGTPYLEVHHRVQLSEGGTDTVENAIALCPNCHRSAHHG